LLSLSLSASQTMQTMQPRPPLVKPQLCTADVTDVLSERGSEKDLEDSDSDLQDFGCSGEPGNSVCLASNVGSELIRAVSASILMEGLGGAFSSSLGTLHVSRGDYSRSLEVPKIDDFISHSWQTARWPKFLAVCLVYNMRVAAVASWLPS